MKRSIFTAFFLTTALMLVSGISPYIKVAEQEGTIKEMAAMVQTVLEEGGYEIIGQYSPGDSPDLSVLVFTSDELIAFSRRSEDRGILAAAMKVGFQNIEGKISVSFVNPEYLFYAYFREMMEDPSFKSAALAISSRVKSTMKGAGPLQESFGGDVAADKLIKYRYMAGMPNFEKAVSLAVFDSYDQALAAIRKGLSGEKNTRKVYEIVSENHQTAMFGIGINDGEKGEAHFLPIIGESHVAAMPYEIVLQGNEVTMLHGRFRFAVHWPELTMKTFTKIMSSPGDVEEVMKSIFETD